MAWAVLGAGGSSADVGSSRSALDAGRGGLAEGDWPMTPLGDFFFIYWDRVAGALDA